MSEGQNNPPAKAPLSEAAAQRLQERYQHLKTQLLELGWIAQGSVMPQPPRAWRLTRKVHAKTVSMALSEQQAALFKQAIANQRKLESLLRKMRALSKQVLLKSVPGVKKRPRQKHPKTRLS